MPRVIDPPSIMDASSINLILTIGSSTQSYLFSEVKRNRSDRSSFSFFDKGGIVLNSDSSRFKTQL